MAKSIMIQGTMSNVGKSIFAAALCRILKQDGCKVAPFKSQNMALNSYITKNGLEMGRAQVMQAEAAGVEPEAFMNPILLKPTTDIGSQVTVGGKVFGNMKAMEYFRHKKEFIPEVLKAYETLDREYDIIVIEGAGSPAELNLKQDDIVNMGLAKMVNAPVILVGDIDRGGVFAQLIGTVKLLENEERERIKGLVVNKFRGDRALFQDGVRILEEKSGKKVVGVVPYMDVDLEDEDSLSSKLQNEEKKMIDIVVIRLPKLSNYTDFDVFRQYSGVSVRYVSDVSKLKEPDLIIIPGTKNTIADCLWLRANGLEAAIKKCAARDIPVFGICGGYQILGMSIVDSHHCEGSSAQKVRGMELLPIRTVFEEEKRQTRVRGNFKKVEGIFAELSGKEITGYEIHMGRSVSDQEEMIEISEILSDRGANHSEIAKDRCPDGCNIGNVYGSYLHGIFDHGQIAETIVRKLYERKGFAFDGKIVSREEYKERQYEKLAKIVRENINMDYIYEIILGQSG